MDELEESATNAEVTAESLITTTETVLSQSQLFNKPTKWVTALRRRRKVPSKLTRRWQWRPRSKLFRNSSFLGEHESLRRGVRGRVACWNTRHVRPLGRHDENSDTEEIQVHWEKLRRTHNDEGCFATTAIQGIGMLLAKCLDKRDQRHEAFVADYTQAFLNAEVLESEQLYAQPPETWNPKIHTDGRRVVRKMCKPILGPRISPWRWQEHLSDKLDICIGVHVDDMLVVGPSDWQRICCGNFQETWQCVGVWWLTSLESFLVFLCAGDRKVTRFQSLCLCDKVLERLWFWRTQGIIQHAQFRETWRQWLYPGQIWTTTSQKVAWFGYTGWILISRMQFVNCPLTSAQLPLVMKSTSSICWYILLEILHATWSLVAILMFLVLRAFRKVRSWWWGRRRQRPSQLLWNCSLVQRFCWKHVVSRECVFLEAEHGLFEFWWFRAADASWESLRGNRNERPMEQIVQMLTWYDCAELCTDSSAALGFAKSKGANRPTRPVDTKVHFLQAWTMDPGHRILKVHGDSQQVADCLKEITTPRAAHRKALVLWQMQQFTSPLLYHRVWAQPPCLRRALRLTRSLLLHDPCHGPGRGWPDTRRDAHCRTPRTSRLLRTRRHVSQSVVVVCDVRWIRATWWRENGRWIRKIWCHNKVISAHSTFSENTRIEHTHDRSGKPDERNSSNAQIRTLLEEQRQTIIAEYREKVGHHSAAHAEEERRLLQGQLCRQKLEFREAHQQSLTENCGKFQSSTLNTIERRKLIEDQNTILELSSSVQELQNEVNCMNDSKDFQNAESVRNGNSHVTSRPVSFPPHAIPGGMLRHSFVSPSRKEGPPSICDTHGISGSVFCRFPCIFISFLCSRIASMEFVNRRAVPFVHSGEKWKTRTKSRSEMPVWTVSQKFSHLQWRRLFKELFGRPTTSAKLGSWLWQVPYTSGVCLLEDKVQDRGMYLFAISYGSDAMDQRREMVDSVYDLRSSPSIRVFQCRILKYLMRGLLQRWTKSSIIIISKEESVWRNKRPRSRIVSFEVDRLLAWSTNNSGSLESMILSKTMPTYSLSVY